MQLMQESMRTTTSIVAWTTFGTKTMGKPWEVKQKRPRTRTKQRPKRETTTSHRSPTDAQPAGLQKKDPPRLRLAKLAAVCSHPSQQLEQRRARLHRATAGQRSRIVSHWRTNGTRSSSAACQMRGQRALLRRGGTHKKRPADEGEPDEPAKKRVRANVAAGDARVRSNQAEAGGRPSQPDEHPEHHDHLDDNGNHAEDSEPYVIVQADDFVNDCRPQVRQWYHRAIQCANANAQLRMPDGVSPPKYYNPFAGLTS